MEKETYGKPIHIWTDEEIRDMPDAGIWFYGLVRQKDGGIIVSEIYPGLGRCNFEISRDELDDLSKYEVEEEIINETYADIGYDILCWNPEKLRAEYPDAEKVDWEKEIEERMKDAVSFESYLKLRDGDDDLD